MRTYLPPNEVIKITHPLVVGVEYAVPTEDGKVIIRNSGVDTTMVIAKEESSEVSFDLQTPSVPAGELKIINYLISIKTNAGLFTKRESVGVVDLLDVPTSVDDILSLLGLKFFELNESQLDIVGSYLKYFKLLKPNFHVARQTNDHLNKAFGDLIALSCSLEIVPTLAISLDKKRSTENGDVTRMATADDLLRLKEDLEDRLANLMADLSEYIEIEELTNYTLFQFVPLFQHSIGA